MAILHDRDNIFSGNYREIGIGIVNDGAIGDLYTQDFGNRSGIGSVVTGVVFDDSSMTNGAYDPGEGLGGATITANPGGHTTTTWASGGYNLSLPSGLYDITASVPGYDDLTYNGLYIAPNINFKVDFSLVPVPTGTQFNLCPGLNLISIPRVNTNFDTASEILNNICGGLPDSMWLYNCNLGTFTSFTVLDPPPGFTVAPTQPFWLNLASATGCLQTIDGAVPPVTPFNLCSGLNLLSLPIYSTSLNTAADLLAVVPTCNGIWQWRKSNGCGEPAGFQSFFPISLPSENFSMHHGHGFYANTTAAGTWTPPNP
jgi:hypothetical protein